MVTVFLDLKKAFDTADQLKTFNVSDEAFIHILNIESSELD